MAEVTENNQEFIFISPFEEFQYGCFSKSVKARPFLVRSKGRIYKDDLLPKPVRREGKGDCFNRSESKLKDSSFHF